ncbi:glycoside hydrolase family 130 protein [Flavobacterium humi]|uniref:Pesticidal protein Cry7Aa n=1 Tax=Flavobacterium humi TaxID=2562683 RepID=A0A4Z0L9L3_9FLAO|nr:pesticidal protein Cry7Aa [Flavobacterium humi]TGD59155.1 pesticidal protein Cry7Aa [Flavobacterium humi]
MIAAKKEGIILQKTSLGFEVDGVLNPAVIQYGDFIHIFYRAVAKNNYSSIGYCKLQSVLEVKERLGIPVLFPQFEFESHGIEDPRIVKIDDLFYMTYTAYDGVNALGALATSKDLLVWEKHGLMVPQIMYDEFNRLISYKGNLNIKYRRYNEHERIKELKGKKMMVWDKNVIFFPRRINKKLYFLHRIKPDMQIAAVERLEDLTTEFWQNYFLDFEKHIVLAPKHKHEASYLGGGCPPIETDKGWLIIYHGVHDSINGYVYCACVALLDLEDPSREIARLPYPLFKPDQEWELKGEVNNVCFPTGTVVIGDTIYIYYGAADRQIACATVSLSELLNELILTSDEK